ncbi:hypothetical protein [Phyllobacterium leguminum]|uniref:Lipoprotein n=1 Tax=Phyllobacterium leguminum TaxID=314237 RepID=A0A318T2I1_9HYPH|nr:hypothetical protein C7477_10516 [Phyllobacterium leguminum]
MAEMSAGHAKHLGLAALPLLLGLAGCTGTATAWTEKFTVEKVELPRECAGWQKIDLKQRTTLALMRLDPRLVVDIDSHNLRGRNLGCWK